MARIAGKWYQRNALGISPIEILVLVLFAWVAQRRVDQWEDKPQGSLATLKRLRNDTRFFANGFLGLQALQLGMAIHDTRDSTELMQQATEGMHANTAESAEVLAAMRKEAEAAREETRAAQRLALWVGAITALIAAIVGGFAGAIAAALVN